MDLVLLAQAAQRSPTPASPTPARRSRSASAPGSARSEPASASAIIFGKEIESVARQPEMKDELQSIRWLGFALTEAVAFYTFIFGLIAFFL